MEAVIGMCLVVILLLGAVFGVFGLVVAQHELTTGKLDMKDRAILLMLMALVLLVTAGLIRLLMHAAAG